MDAIVAFYRGEQPDAAGRRLDDIWSWDLDRLEHTHDYIQWIFPLDVPSGVNPLAPLVTAETLKAFEWDDVLRDRLMRSFDLMLRFFGFERRMAPDGLVIAKTPAFVDRAPVWLQPGNHNHLRLTRILKSLRLFGFDDEARALFVRLVVVREQDGADAISDDTAAYWRDAANA